MCPGAGTIDPCKANCDHVENFGCVTPMRCPELYTATAGMCVKEFKKVSRWILQSDTNTSQDTQQPQACTSKNSIRWVEEYSNEMPMPAKQPQE